MNNPSSYTKLYLKCIRGNLIIKKVRNSINHYLDFIWEHIQSDFPDPAKVDALYIAYALETSVPVVTDDQDMKEFAAVFDAL